MFFKENPKVQLPNSMIENEQAIIANGLIC
jgi:hypothetical protein